MKGYLLYATSKYVYRMDLETGEKEVLLAAYGNIDGIKCLDEYGKKILVGGRLDYMYDCRTNKTIVGEKEIGGKYSVVLVDLENIENSRVVLKSYSDVVSFNIFPKREAKGFYLVKGEEE